MEVREEVSYGVVPFQKVGEDWQVFLIEQISRIGDVFWTFPKGHPETNETPEAAAERELREETGLILTKLYANQQFSQSYTFVDKGTEIRKTANYYLGVTNQADFSLQASEVNDAHWFSIEEARAKLTHEDTKRIFDQAVAALAAL